MNKQITPPTELTDDAILEMAREFCIGGVYKNDIISFAKALLSRKSESEAVAEVRCRNGEVFGYITKKNAAKLALGEKLFTSPQPSDDWAGIPFVNIYDEHPAQTEPSDDEKLEAINKAEKLLVWGMDIAKTNYERKNAMHDALHLIRSSLGQ